MLGLSLAMTIACITVVFVAATVQASIGIGLGMIASPVLLFADPDFIPTAIMLAVLPLTFTVAWVDREHIEARDVGFALIGRVPGVIAGALVVAALSERVLAVMVAASVLLAVLASITGRLFEPTDRALVVAGLASERVRPVLEVAMARFQHEEALRRELTDARSQLSDRKTIDRAKGILMNRHAVSEEEAYSRLRTSDQLQVSVTRNGTPVNIDFHIR